jgi:small subunit ribosomal protein S17
MEKNTKARKLKGVVVSDKMDKTVVIEVKTMKVHPKYGKRYLSSKKYKCHDEKNECSVGDKITIVECRPISKDKTWRVIDKIN